jgi:hypothetical protein
MLHLLYLYSVLIVIGFLFVFSLSNIVIKTFNLDMVKISKSSKYHSVRRFQLTNKELGDLKI